MFLAWRTVHAKALRQECAWCIGGTAREPVWLERSKGSNGWGHISAGPMDLSKDSASHRE